MVFCPLIISLHQSGFYRPLISHQTYLLSLFQGRSFVPDASLSVHINNRRNTQCGIMFSFKFTFSFLSSSLYSTFNFRQLPYFNLSLKNTLVATISLVFHAHFVIHGVLLRDFDTLLLIHQNLLMPVSNDFA